MNSTQQISESLRLEYLSSIKSNRNKSMEQLALEPEILVAYSELNVWFLNRNASQDCIDLVKKTFESLEQSKLSKCRLRDFTAAYAQKLSSLDQSIQEQQVKAFSLNRVLANAEILENHLKQSVSLGSAAYQRNFDNLSKTTASTASSSAAFAFEGSPTCLIHDIHLGFQDDEEEEIHAEPKEVNHSPQLAKTLKTDKKQAQELSPSMSWITLKLSLSELEFSKYSTQSIEQEQFYIEIGTEKQSKKTKLQSCCIDGKVDFSNEYVRIKLRPKAKTVSVKLISVTRAANSQRQFREIASAVIDPFGFVSSSLLSRDCNNMLPQWTSVPLSTSNPLPYSESIQLKMSASLIESEVEDHDELLDVSVLINHTNPMVVKLIQAATQSRIAYMREKLRSIESKLLKIVNNIKILMQPFQSIHLFDDSYTTQNQVACC